MHSKAEFVRFGPRLSGRIYERPKRAGEPVVEPCFGNNRIVSEAPERADMRRVHTVLKLCFGEAHCPKLEGSPRVVRVLHEERYRGVGIVRDLEGLRMLSNLAVLEEARRQGMASAIMMLAIGENPSLVWHTSLFNPARRMYANCADGWFVVDCAGSEPPGVIYWRGLEYDKLAWSIRKVHALETGGLGADL